MQCPDECKDNFKEIVDAIEKLHDKLFVGNGQPPITVQIDRLNAFKKLSTWVMGASFMALLGLIARLVFDLIKNS